MILDPWKSTENLVQILREPFLDLFSSSFKIFKLYVAFSGFTAWQVYLQNGIWHNNLKESRGKTGKKLVFFYIVFLFL